MEEEEEEDEGRRAWELLTVEFGIMWEPSASESPRTVTLSAVTQTSLPACTRTCARLGGHHENLVRFVFC